VTTRVSIDESSLAQLRAQRFRQYRSRRIRTEQAALQFVNDVGFCSTFFVFPEGVPCLWEAVAGQARPRWPRHSHHDAAVGRTWALKDTLPARRTLYYGKVLKGRPLLVALDVFAAFYALRRGRQRARDYRIEYDAGRLSLTAKRLLDSLVREHPQYTRDLRADCFMLEPSRTREFERGMAELQHGLWVVKTAERYEPTFSYRWDLLEQWLPEAVAEGRRLSRPAAIERLIARYTAAAVYTSERIRTRLLGLAAAETRAAVERLRSRGVLTGPAPVVGLPGAWLIDASAPTQPTCTGRQHRRSLA
jgi:hypothetical protein